MSSPETDRPVIPEDAKGVDRLLAIMRILRSEQGCPWDREQTLQTLKENLVEETHEVLEAIDHGDRRLLEEELGDLLLQVVFQSQICAEEGAFDFQDVVRNISDKLERRHPHVFGEVKASNASEALQSWDAMKAKEKGDRKASALDGVPRELPSLHKAQKIQRKAAKVGFDWDNPDDVLAKVDEEVAELKDALASQDAERIKDEVGDVLFAVVNASRFHDCHAEDALRGTIAKFERRFRDVEHRLDEKGKTPEESTLQEMDMLWNEVKALEKGSSTLNPEP